MDMLQQQAEQVLSDFQQAVKDAERKLLDGTVVPPELRGTRFEEMLNEFNAQSLAIAHEHFVRLQANLAAKLSKYTG